MALLGKILVMLNLAISLVFLVVALGIFTNSINWGWKAEHQRQQFGTKIASEFDKRKEVLRTLDEAKPRFVTAWTQARAKLVKTEANIARDQLRYVDELKRIQAGRPVPLLKMRELEPYQWLFDQKKRSSFIDNKIRTDKPLLQDDFTKSYQGYFTEIGNLTTQINGVREKDKRRHRQGKRSHGKTNRAARGHGQTGQGPVRPQNLGTASPAAGQGGAGGSARHIRAGAGGFTVVYAAARFAAAPVAATGEFGSR
jgi:hypothetical protein